MASRPIYIPCFDGSTLVTTDFVDFKWHPGMAPSQKKKSVESLHSSAKRALVCKHPLEISSKSLEPLGVELSAFNLTVTTEKQRRKFTVETAYQSSKKFRDGGPYKDLLYGTSLAAKKDSRIRNSGPIVAFEFFGQLWPLEPRTAFYDWLYINALKKNTWAVERLQDYDAFTDIEFNPKKSINCQAYSVALFLSLQGRGLLADATSGKEEFLGIVGSASISSATENTVVQPRLV